MFGVATRKRPALYPLHRIDVGDFVSGGTVLTAVGTGLKIFDVTDYGDSATHVVSLEPSWVEHIYGLWGAVVSFGDVEPSARLIALFTADASAHDVELETGENDFAEAERTFIQQLGLVSPALRTSVRVSFLNWLNAAREDEEEICISLGSLRNAMGFIQHDDIGIAPSFGVSNDGNCYLQWFDGTASLLGITFKPDGKVIWSSSQRADQGVGRTAEAGERSAESMQSFLPTLAPWISDRSRA